MGYYWRGDERRFIIDELKIGTRINDIALMLGRHPLHVPSRQIGKRVSDFIRYTRDRDPDLREAYEAWRTRRSRRPRRQDPKTGKRARSKAENDAVRPLIECRWREGHTASAIAAELGAGWSRSRVLGIIHRRKLTRRSS